LKEVEPLVQALEMIGHFLHMIQEFKSLRLICSSAFAPQGFVLKEVEPLVQALEMIRLFLHMT
jgi:hypothetical protein